MTRIRNETDLQSIPLADRLKELSLGKKFPKAVLNGIAIDPARKTTVVAHCLVSNKTPHCSERKNTVFLQLLADGPNYTRYRKYLLGKTSEIIFPTVGLGEISLGFALQGVAE